MFGQSGGSSSSTSQQGIAPQFRNPLSQLAFGLTTLASPAFANLLGGPPQLPQLGPGGLFPQQQNWMNQQMGQWFPSGGGGAPASPSGGLSFQPPGAGGAYGGPSIGGFMQGQLRPRTTRPFEMTGPGNMMGSNAEGTTFFPPTGRPLMDPTYQQPQQKPVGGDFVLNPERLTPGMAPGAAPQNVIGGTPGFYDRMEQGGGFVKPGPGVGGRPPVPFQPIGQPGSSSVTPPPWGQGGPPPFGAIPGWPSELTSSQNTALQQWLGGNTPGGAVPNELMSMIPPGMWPPNLPAPFGNVLGSTTPTFPPPNQPPGGAVTPTNAGGMSFFPPGTGGAYGGGGPAAMGAMSGAGPLPPGSGPLGLPPSLAGLAGNLPQMPGLSNLGLLPGQQSAFNLPTANLPGLTASGLLPQQQTAFDTAFSQAVQQAVNPLSASAAMRGQLSPENIGGIAGSAAQNVAPQFLPQMLQTAGQNVLNQTLLPQQMQLANLGALAPLASQNMAMGLQNPLNQLGTVGPLALQNLGLGLGAQQQFFNQGGQIGQNLMQQATLPQAMYLAQLAPFMGLIQQMTGLLGGSSQATSNQYGFNVGTGGLSFAGGGGGGGGAF